MTLDPELACQDTAPDRPPHCVVALDGPDGDAGPVVDCGLGDFNCADWPVALAVVGVSWEWATLFRFLFKLRNASFTNAKRAFVFLGRRLMFGGWWCIHW